MISAYKKLLKNIKTEPVTYHEYFYNVINMIYPFLYNLSTCYLQRKRLKKFLNKFIFLFGV